MATLAVQSDYTESELPLYRMDVGTYNRLVDAGALEGVEVELLDGLLINKRSHQEDAVHRLDVGTFERMVATGELGARGIELLDGLLIKVSPQGALHATMIRRLTEYLAGMGARLGVQLPLETKWGSLPEPDLVLTERVPLVDQHPRTALLAIEVAVTSHQVDRDYKTHMYALAPVWTYWLVDIPAKTVEVRSEPGPHGYGRCEVYRLGAKVPSPAEGVADLDVTELFDGFPD